MLLPLTLAALLAAPPPAAAALTVCVVRPMLRGAVAAADEALAEALVIEARKAGRDVALAFSEELGACREGPDTCRVDLRRSGLARIEVDGVSREVAVADLDALDRSAAIARVVMVAARADDEQVALVDALTLQLAAPAVRPEPVVAALEPPAPEVDVQHDTRREVPPSGDPPLGGPRVYTAMRVESHPELDARASVRLGLEVPFVWRWLTLGLEAHYTPWASVADLRTRDVGVTGLVGVAFELGAGVRLTGRAGVGLAHRTDAGAPAEARGGVSSIDDELGFVRLGVGASWDVPGTPLYLGIDGGVDVGLGGRDYLVLRLDQIPSDRLYRSPRASWGGALVVGFRP